MGNNIKEKKNKRNIKTIFRKRGRLGRRAKTKWYPTRPTKGFVKMMMMMIMVVMGDGGGAAEPTNAFAIATIPNITDVITAQILEIIDSE